MGEVCEHKKTIFPKNISLPSLLREKRLNLSLTQQTLSLFSLQRSRWVLFKKKKRCDLQKKKKTRESLSSNSSCSPLLRRLLRLRPAESFLPQLLPQLLLQPHTPP